MDDRRPLVGGVVAEEVCSTKRASTGQAMVALSQSPKSIVCLGQVLTWFFSWAALEWDRFNGFSD